MMAVSYKIVNDYLNKYLGILTAELSPLSGEFLAPYCYLLVRRQLSVVAFFFFLKKADLCFSVFSFFCVIFFF